MIIPLTAVSIIILNIIQFTYISSQSKTVSSLLKILNNDPAFNSNLKICQSDDEKNFDESCAKSACKSALYVAINHFDRKRSEIIQNISTLDSILKNKNLRISVESKIELQKHKKSFEKTKVQLEEIAKNIRIDLE